MFSNQTKNNINEPLIKKEDNFAMSNVQNNKNMAYENDASLILPDNGCVDQALNAVINDTKSGTLFTIQELDSTNDSYPAAMDVEDFISIKSEPIQEETETDIMGPGSGISCSLTNKDTVPRETSNATKRSIDGNIINRPFNQEVNIVQRITQVERKLDIVIAQQAQTLSLLRQLVKNKKSCDSLEFPIRDAEDLDAINKKIINGEADFYINLMETRLSDVSLTKGFERIFHMSLVMQMNYDGIQNKLALKEYRGIMECLYQATKKEQTSEADFVRIVRVAIKLCKNRYFKKKCMNLKKQKITDA